jgi:DNA invertase Pin-like site-specific DNA recombinase
VTEEKTLALPDRPDDGAVSETVRDILRGRSRPQDRKGLRAVGYTRVSSTMQKLFGKSMEDQAHRIRTFIAGERWEEVAILSDPAQSGRSGKRPAFKRLKRVVTRGQVDVVVVDRIDRISRNMMTLLTFIRVLEEHDVKLVSLREQIDFDTVWGELVLYILGALSEFYSEILSQEMRLRRYHSARSGHLSGAYRLGYCKGNCSECDDPNGEGYCPHYGGEDRTEGKIRVDHPIERKAVRLMYAWYAAGDHSYDDVAHRLNEQVFTLPDGQEVRFRTKGVPNRHPPGPFTKDAVRDIIRNPIYAGYVTYAGSDVDGERRRKPVELFEGKHPALVGYDLWRRAQRVRKSRYRRSQSRTGKARTYPLSRLVFCAEAHMPMRGVSSGGGKYRYYADKLCKQKMTREHWHQPNVSAPEVEREVQALVTHMHIPPRWQEHILAYVHYDEGMAELAYERQLVRQRMERAAELYEEGLYDREKLARVEAKCRRQLRAIEPSGTAAGGEAAQLLENLPALWEALTDAEQNNLYRILLNGVYMRGQAIAAIEPQRPFLPLLEEAAQRLAEERGEPLPYRIVERPSAPDPELVSLLER